MPLLSIVYCTQADMERYLSILGVADFSDNDQDGLVDVPVVEDVINQATEEIDLRAGQRYTQAQLQTSTLITRWCTVMACTFLAQRRGNPVPDSLMVEYERITDTGTGLLFLVSKGKEQLPRIPLRADMRPIWSNQTIDRRFYPDGQRVIPEISSDSPTVLDQDIAPRVIP